MNESTPQLTLRAILLGVLLAILLGAANVYLGLFAGMTVSASIPAAVLSMAILRALRGGLLENNLVQTAASAGESLAAGVIFTFPALVLLGYWQRFDWWQVTLIAGTGGLLGVLFTVPIRRALVVEQPLPFPEGTATAEVLKAGDKGGQSVQLLLIGAVIGAFTKVAQSGLQMWNASLEVAGFIGDKVVAFFGTSTSAALVGVGYIVGFNVAVLVFAGGALAWFVAIPLYSGLWISDDPITVAKASEGAAALAWHIWNSQIRYLGVGAMLIGGLWAVLGLWRPLLKGLRLQKQAVTNSAERDMPLPMVLAGIVVLLIPIFFIYNSVVDNPAIAAPMTLVMVVAGFLFCAVAAYMAGMVGSSHNPVSGMTIATLLLASLMLLALGFTGTKGAVAAIMIGAVVCCAAAIGGDNVQDLKAGHILGATPWKQQLMQVLGVLAAAVFMAPVLNILLTGYGFGPATDAQPNALAAPQATLMAAVADGILGDSQLPWPMVIAGACIGALIIAGDLLLQRLKSDFRLPVLAVAVGIYLPLELSVPIALGGFIALLGSGRKPTQKGVLFAAGLITGEALLGILLAVPAAFGSIALLGILPLLLAVGGLLRLNRS